MTTPVDPPATTEERLTAIEAQLKVITAALEALHGMNCGVARLDDRPQDLELARCVLEMKASTRPAGAALDVPA